MSVAYCMCILCYLLFFFFFSSRRRHTRCSRDWSSDVCSSDLLGRDGDRVHRLDRRVLRAELRQPCATVPAGGRHARRGLHARVRGARRWPAHRSEERRVGKEWREWVWGEGWNKKGSTSTGWRC